LTLPWNDSNKRARERDDRSRRPGSDMIRKALSNPHRGDALIVAESEYGDGASPAMGLTMSEDLQVGEWR
jgi:hypothetical protein